MEKHNLSRRSKENLSGVKNPIKLLVQRSLKKSKHDFGIPNDGGRRTPQRQNELFLLVPKVTNCDGYIKKSYHQSGMAFDIFLFDEHGACWKCLSKYKEIADTIKQEFKVMQNEGHFCSCERLQWGGDWKHPDRPHFQIVKR